MNKDKKRGKRKDKDEKTEDDHEEEGEGKHEEQAGGDNFVLLIFLSGGVSKLVSCDEGLRKTLAGLRHDNSETSCHNSSSFLSRLLKNNNNNKKVI